MEYGTIFDIKQFAVFDGPGMRQTVFLKGCPLHCSWCHNPEGQCVSPQLMFSYASCTHCGACRKVCPSPDKCIACGRCIDVCPLNLRHISGERISSEELVRRLRHDADIYKRNGGGVTFSGGEPLMQPSFLKEVLVSVPDMHRAIETSGYASSDVYRDIYDSLDFIIQDIKIFDDEEHKKHIGASNRNILANAAMLRDGKKPFIIRIPLIPGVTDTERNLTDIAEFLKGSGSLVRVELLPYLKVAGAKYGMVGRAYDPKDFNPEDKPSIRQDIFEERNIRSIVL